MNSGLNKETAERKVKEALLQANTSLMGSQLFSRPHPSGYSQEWEESLRQAPFDEDLSEGASWVLFRIENEWLALSTNSIYEVTELNFIHTIPKVSSKLVLGISNVQGQVHIGISLRALLGFEDSVQVARPSLSKRIYPRALLFGQAHAQYLFPVDEVYGLVQASVENDSKKKKQVARPALSKYIQGFFVFKEMPVGVLDAEKLFKYIEDNCL